MDPSFVPAALLDGDYFAPFDEAIKSMSSRSDPWAASCDMTAPPSSAVESLGDESDAQNLFREASPLSSASDPLIGPFDLLDGDRFAVELPEAEAAGGSSPSTATPFFPDFASQPPAQPFRALPTSAALPSVVEQRAPLLPPAAADAPGAQVMVAVSATEPTELHVQARPPPPLPLTEAKSPYKPKSPRAPRKPRAKRAKKDGGEAPLSPASTASTPSTPPQAPAVAVPTAPTEEAGAGREAAPKVRRRRPILASFPRRPKGRPVKFHYKTDGSKFVCPVVDCDEKQTSFARRCNCKRHFERHFLRGDVYFCNDCMSPFCKKRNFIAHTRRCTHVNLTGFDYTEIRQTMEKVVAARKRSLEEAEFDDEEKEEDETDGDNDDDQDE